MLRSMALVLFVALTAMAEAGPEPLCSAPGDKDALPFAKTGHGPEVLARDSVLLQLRRAGAGAGADAAAAEAPAIESGDIVFLKVNRSGHRITFQQNGQVHAKWSNKGEWEQLAIERVAGPGAVQSGDLVLLRGVWGKPLTVQGKAAHALWDHEGSWQKLTIETKEGGAIRAGSVVFLKAHTGARIDADAPGSAGAVQARWSHMGGWQALIVEPRTQPTATTTSAPTTPAPTTPPTTSTTSSSTSTAPAASCVEPASLGKCEPCLTTAQCGGGRYCCPYMKKCVLNSREACSRPIADCRPMCHDSMDNQRCTCGNAAFPSEWQLPTCSEAAEVPAPSSSLPTTAASTAAPSTATATTTATAEATSSSSTTSTAPSSAVSKVSARAWEHFVLLNDLRAAGFTCPGNETYDPNPVPLKFDCRLWRASQLHSQDMADNRYFSHSSQDGTSPWERARRQNTSASGENIAAGSSAADRSLGQFKRSDGHCKNMLSPRQRVAGVGYGYSESAPYRHYWTQMFGAWTEAVETWCYPDGVALAQAGPADEQGEDEADLPVEIGEAWTVLK